MERNIDPADYLHLTIISDCCFSNKWVEKLKEDIDKGVGSKYGHYPICIQGAASEDAYDNTLLALLFPKDGVLPLCAGQDPAYICTLAYHSSFFGNRLTNRNDYEAKFNPGTVPSRRGLSIASGRALKACEDVIDLWDWDCVGDKREAPGTIVKNGSARIDFQGLSYNKMCCNLQVQINSESFAQVHILLDFCPGRETIKKFLKKSLHEKVTYWLYKKEMLPICHTGTMPPPQESAYSVLLSVSETQKGALVSFLDSQNWTPSRIQEIIESQPQVYPAIVYVKSGGQRWHDFRLLLGDGHSAYPVARVLVLIKCRPENSDVIEKVKGCFVKSLNETEIYWIKKEGHTFQTSAGSIPPVEVQ